MSVLGDMRDVTLQPSTLSFSAVPSEQRAGRAGCSFVCCLVCCLVCIFGRRQAAFWLTVTLQPILAFASAVVIDGPKSVDFQDCAARVLNEAFCFHACILQCISFSPSSGRWPVSAVSDSRLCELKAFAPCHLRPGRQLPAACCAAGQRVSPRVRLCQAEGSKLSCVAGTWPCLFRQLQPPHCAEDPAPTLPRSRAALLNAGWDEESRCDGHQVDAGC